MSKYKIKDYSYEQARKLGVTIKVSSHPSKKIDIYKDGDKIASIGASEYSDYPSWIQSKGKSYADERRRLYKARHEKDLTKIGSPGYYANKILW